MTFAFWNGKPLLAIGATLARQGNTLEPVWAPFLKYFQTHFQPHILSIKQFARKSKTLFYFLTTHFPKNKYYKIHFPWKMGLNQGFNVPKKKNWLSLTQGIWPKHITLSARLSDRRTFFHFLSSSFLWK